MKIIKIIRDSYFKLIETNSLKSEIVYFVMNNSSCDMDSFISSISLAAARNIQEDVITFNNQNEWELSSYNNRLVNKIYIPLMNCKRGELKNRLDIAFVMKKFKIEEENLFYINDPEVEQYINENSQNFNFKIILVDHNKLEENYLHLLDKVEEIIDHHDDRNNILQYKNLTSKTLKFPLGSCSTLILHDYFICNKKIKDNISKIIDPLLLLTALLLDTLKFQKNLYINRWVDMDYYVFESITQSENISQFVIDQYYNELDSSKYDEDANLNLGVENLMNKDKKLFKWGSHYASWSSLQVTYESLINKYEWSKIEEYFMKEKEINKNLNFFITISKFSNKEKSVRIVEIYDYENKLSCSIEKFNEHLKKELGDNLLNLNSQENLIKIYVNESISRKLLEPVLNKYFNK
jgi:inorganic pyrophosphatase/exopolyphosphatase